MVKGAVTAGVLSYASGTIDNSLGLKGIKPADMSFTQQLQRGVANTLVKSTLNSAVYGTDFGDSLKMGLATDISNLGFRYVGDTSMGQYLGEGNDYFKDGGIGKIALHSVVGGASAELMGGDFTSGAVSAGVNELASPLLDGLDDERQQAISGFIGGVAAGAVGGEDQANIGSTIAQSATQFNRQLHEKEIKFIEENSDKFAKLLYGDNPTSEQLQDAKSRLAQQGLRGADKAWSLILGEQTDIQAQDFITKNSNGLFSVKNEYEFKDGTTNGQSEISDLNQNDYNQLKTFYQNNVYTTTSTNTNGNQFLGEAYKQDVGKDLDSISWSGANQAIRDFFPNAIESVKNTPETVNSASNYLENVLPTTTQDRMDELYNQGNVGSKVQANLATMDAIGTASMITGVGAVGKSVVGGVGKSVDDFTTIYKKAPDAKADSRKFSDYIFKPEADHGKDTVFKSLGYSAEDSTTLASIWEKQATEKFAKGEFSLGKADQYGQRINIEIALPKKGSTTEQTSYLKSGWMIQPDGSIKLNTPFSGFTRSEK